MGIYINPTTMTKEAWLKEFALDCKDAQPLWESIPTPKSLADDDKFLPVVLIDNGNFSACGVAYCEREYKEFLAEDGRPKRVYVVEMKYLKQVSELGAYLK